ncbi:MAG TPA: site-specific integrase [Thermoanaerobacterales bacterium]|jgi:hypothetical protein|nr:site-specific integrase [Thermoanaerobacterales bacterium]
MGKRPSLVYQIDQRFKGMFAYGESRHAAKEALKAELKEQGIKYNPTIHRLPKIYSFNTMKNYRQVVFDFIKALKEEGIKVRYLEDITPEMAKSYLLSKQERGYSPYSLSKDIAALNKFFDWNLTKREIGLQERSKKQITRSRLETKEDRKYNPRNWERHITFARAFGVRRQSIYGGQFQVRASSVYRCKVDGRIYVAVVEKGGRFRNAPCLKKYEKYIKEMFPNMQEKEEEFTEPEFREHYKRARKAKEPFIFDRYTKKIDNHAFRGEYARAYYNELCEQKQSKGKEIKSDYRGYDGELVAEVSKALGHNRLSVVVDHYFR